MNTQFQTFEHDAKQKRYDINNMVKTNLKHRWW